MPLVIVRSIVFGSLLLRTFKIVFYTDLMLNRGEPTPSTLTLVAEKALTRPLPLREIQARKKVVLFFCRRNSLFSRAFQLL
jgi:hypothetical protein